MVISIIHQRGGPVGRPLPSTSPPAWRPRAKRVLLIDMDPAANTTTGIGLVPDAFGRFHRPAAYTARVPRPGGPADELEPRC